MVFGGEAFGVRQLAAAFQRSQFPVLSSQLSCNLEPELETLNSKLESGSKLPHSESALRARKPCGTSLLDPDRTSRGHAGTGRIPIG